MRLEDGVLPAVVAKLEDGDVAIGGGAGEEAASLVRGPADNVDRGLVEREIKDALPGAGLLAPDEDLAVVAGRGEDVAVFGVGPGDGPYCAVMSFVLRVGLARLERYTGDGRAEAYIPLECLD